MSDINILFRINLIPTNNQWRWAIGKDSKYFILQVDDKKFREMTDYIFAVYSGKEVPPLDVLSIKKGHFSIHDGKEIHGDKGNGYLWEFRHIDNQNIIEGVHQLKGTFSGMAVTNRVTFVTQEEMMGKIIKYISEILSSE